MIVAWSVADDELKSKEKEIREKLVLKLKKKVIENIFQDCFFTIFYITHEWEMWFWIDVMFCNTAVYNWFQWNCTGLQ